MAKAPPNNKANLLSRRPDLAARFLAFESLQDSSIRALPTDRLAILAGHWKIGSRDRAFAYDLLAGTIKRRLTLDHLIGRFSSRNVKTLSSPLLTLLRLGLFQLLFEDRVPDFAAVDTTCELAKFCASRPQVGFINAILRTALRAIQSRETPIAGANAQCLLPAGPDAGILFSKPIFPDPDTGANYLAAVYSFPRWLVARWLTRWDLQTLRQVLAALNGRPAISLRPNRLKLEFPAAPKLAEILTHQNCQVKVLPDVDMLELIDGPPLSDLPAFAEGLFQVQDSTAAEAVKNLSPKPGMRILDYCAGLGTKTTQLAELSGDKGEIYAYDRAQGKLDRLLDNAKRLGMQSIRALSTAQMAEPHWRGFFNAVLLDVPCSNTGVLDRRPEARWRIKPADFAVYTRQSRELLALATEFVKPDGQIVFSTCSIDDEENSDLIALFCEQSGWKVYRQCQHQPAIDPETKKTFRTGGYWAILSR